MNPRTLLALGALAAALALPAAAAAKGPSAARVEGPGLEAALSIAGDGEAGPGTPLGSLTLAAGFFPAVFDQSPDPMLQSRPKGDLGPRYTITWVVPGPNGKSLIRQDVYPYAKLYPVTYMRPGQPFWDGERTHGGWFQGGSSLEQTLVAAGLPVRAPSSGGGSGLDAGELAALSAGAAVLLLLALAAVRMRRRPREAAA